jgi:hypothetical protein
VTTKLVSGRKFKVKVFQIVENITPDDCLAFLKSQEAVLVGAQGASLAYEQNKDQLPVNRWSASFDEKEALPSIYACHRVSDVRRFSTGDFEFNLVDFEGEWGIADCLLCFCDWDQSA